MNKLMKKSVLILFIISTSLQAKDLGTYGETFPIVEENLLTVIKTKLQTLGSSGELEAHQKKIQEEAAKRLQRPAEVTGIIKTKKPRVFSYNPSITVPYDLKDDKGKIFFKAGTTVNPLDMFALKYTLLFIDGDDKEQVNWAINHKVKFKIILIKGSPFELMKEHGTPVYFDQGGTLVKKFGITQVPARITQEGKNLKVEEVLSLEGGSS